MSVNIMPTVVYANTSEINTSEASISELRQEILDQKTREEIFYTDSGVSEETASAEKAGEAASTSNDMNTKYSFSSVKASENYIPENTYLNKNGHYIIVLDTNSNAIEGASVAINGSVINTDMNGIAIFNNVQDIKDVKVTAEGYRDNIQHYNVKNQEFRAIFLEKDKRDKKPYVTMACNTSDYYDLRYQTDIYVEDEGDMLDLEIKANWNGQKEGTYVIYQDSVVGGNSGKKITSNNGKFKFAPGKVFEPSRNIKFKLVSENKIESEPIELRIAIADKIHDDTETNENGLENKSGLKIAKEQNGKLKDRKASLIFPGDFSLKISALPIQITKTVNDGVIAYRGTIGIGKNDYLKSEKNWSDFKVNFNNLKKNMGDTKKCKSLMKTFKPKSGHLTVEKKLFDPEINSVGYLEIKTDKNGNILESTGGVIVNGSLESKVSEQFWAGPVPIYIDLSGKISIETLLGLGYNFKNDDFVFNGELYITPSIAVGGGLGVSGIATVGVEGSGRLKILVIPKSKGDLTLQASIKAYLIFLFNWHYVIAKKTFNLWDSGKAVSISMFEKEVLNMEKEELSLASREYNQYTTDWNPNKITGSNDDSQPINITSLQDWIMPNTIPELINIGNQTIMFFHTDMAEKAIGNNIALMYSLYDETTDTWSIPQTVSDKDTSDLYYKTLIYNDELYLIWQKVTNELKETEVQALYDSILVNTGISVAKWNKTTKKFEQSFINSDDKIDMYPTLAAEGGNIKAVWVNNSENNILGSGGTYSILSSEYSDGSWSEPVKLYETDKYISELSASITNKKLNVIFALNTEDDAANIYKLNDGIAKPIDGQKGTGTQLKSLNNKFYWYSEGVINIYDAASDKLSYIDAGKSKSISSYYSLTGNSNNEAITWLSYDSQETEGDNALDTSYINASLRVGDSWSEPICLYKTNEVEIKTLSANLNDNGSWEFIMNTESPMNNGLDMNSLIYAKAKAKSDTEVSYAIIDEKDGLSDKHPVVIGIKNNGQKTVGSFDMTISDDKTGKIYYSDTKKCNIGIGEITEFTVNLDLSDITEETNLKVTVLSDNDTDVSNDTTNINIGYVNVKLDIESYDLGDKVLLYAKVSNDSQIPANTTIRIVEDTPDGIAAETKNIGRLTNENDYVYLYKIDKNEIQYNGNDYKHYYIIADTLEEDLDISDNTEVIAVYPDEEYIPSNAPMEEVNYIPVTGIRTQKEITLNYDGENEVTAQIDAEIYPSNASNKDITWSSDDISVVNVNNEGVITVFGIGTANITAKTKDGAYSSVIKVTINQVNIDTVETTTESYRDETNTETTTAFITETDTETTTSKPSSGGSSVGSGYRGSFKKVVNTTEAATEATTEEKSI